MSLNDQLLTMCYLPETNRSATRGALSRGRTPFWMRTINERTPTTATHTVALAWLRVWMLAFEYLPYPLDRVGH
ncbi:hypothetical protein Mycsm_03641 [Mycobacterium sp. JS623]|nr:hypothetical protein Mycsm_03641 [Mycobacterium sp. JS623]